MVHFRSPSWLIPAASHDGFSTDVHHHDSFTTAARGGLTPAPACRCRRTYLHVHNSMVAVIVLPSTSENPSSLQGDRLSGPTRMLGSCVMVVLTESGSPGSGVAVAAAKPKPGDADAPLRSCNAGCVRLSRSMPLSWRKNGRSSLFPRSTWTVGFWMLMLASCPLLRSAVCIFCLPCAGHALGWSW